MSDYISREELRKHLKACYNNVIFDADMRKATFAIDSYVENMPAVDVQPVRHRLWIRVDNGRGGHRCSMCDEYAPSYQSGNEYLSNFCPNCGARMDCDTE